MSASTSPAASRRPSRSPIARRSAAVAAVRVNDSGTPSDLDLLEVDQVGEGGEPLADLAEIEPTKPIEAEVLDRERGQDRAQDHRRSDGRRAGVSFAGDPAHEAAAERVAGAGRVDDVLDRERRRSEDAA